MMTEMEQDIYNRAIAHYKKKYDILVEGDYHNTVITEFWMDYFSEKPIYTEEGLPDDEQRRLLGLHGSKTERGSPGTACWDPTPHVWG